MSEKYQDLKYTKFPNEIDTLHIFKDVDVTTKPYVDQFYQYYNAGQFNEANQVILDHPELKDCLINAEMLQTLHDANIALQRTFSSSIIDLFASVIKYQNTFSSTKKYNLYDMFYYQGIPYLVIKQNTPTGTYPPNTTYYAQLAIVGASGTGLSFKESWTSSTIYSQYDCVPYNNQLWVSLVANNVGHTPTSGSTYWKSIITVPRQIIVSETQPTGQTTGDIWFEYSSGTLKIHEKLSSGYRDLLPEMTADNINYETGLTLKQALSNHFSASNPHAITCTKIGAATSTHTHDSRYYTETEMDTKLGEKLEKTNGQASNSIKISGASPTLSLYIDSNTEGELKANNGKLDILMTKNLKAAKINIDPSAVLQSILKFTNISYIAGPAETNYMIYGTHNITMSQSTDMPSPIKGCIHMVY